jgi:histidine triad (HIT) family protein
VQERLNWLVSKTSEPQGSEGSNPSLSATIVLSLTGLFLVGYNNGMQDSIFTKIIKGEIPSHKIYEDDDVIAFLDIHPVMPGHTLVVPKKQVEFVWDLDDELYAKLTLVAKNIALHIRGILETTYVGEQIIGVDVPHAHIQLIPFTNAVDFHQHIDQSLEPDHAALGQMASLLSL